MTNAEQAREQSSNFFKGGFGRLFRGLGRRAVEPSLAELLTAEFITKIESAEPNAAHIRTASSQPVAPEQADEVLNRVSDYFALPSIKNLDIVQAFTTSETLMDYDRGFNLQPLIVRGFLAKLGSLSLEGIGGAKLVVKVPRERDTYSLVVATPTPDSLFAIQNIQPQGQTEPLRLHYADIPPRFTV